MYWRIKNWLINKYIKLKYGKKPVKVYYDKFIKQYVNPKYLDLTCDKAETLLSDMVTDSLIYPFFINEDKSHKHEFERVMMIAYEHGDAFSVGEYKEYYSTQQLRLLEKLAKKGQDDCN